MKKAWYMSKTIWFSIITFVVGILSSVVGVVPQSWTPWVLLVVAVLSGVMRLITDTGIKKPGDQP